MTDSLRQSDLSMYHPLVARIKTLLDDHSVWYKTFTHEAVRTSEEAALVRPNYTLAQGAKALLLRVKRRGGAKQFVQLVLPGDQQFNTKHVKAELQVSDLRFATPDEVRELTDGVEPGGVPPFGNLFDLPVYADADLLKEETLIFNAGDKQYSIALRTADYQAIVAPTVLELTT